MSSFEDSILRVMKGNLVVGAAFLVTNRLVATCAHVVRSAGVKVGAKISLRLSDGKEIEGIVEPEFWRDPNAEDISILRLNEPLENIQSVILGSSSGTKGHNFSTFGFPKKGQELSGGGEIIGQAIIDGMRLLHLRSEEVTPGFSGAPIFDEITKRVVGMVVAIEPPDEYQRLGTTAFAVQSEILCDVCGELEFSLPIEAELGTSFPSSTWLKEYAEGLETKFLAHLCQQEKFDRAEAKTRYIEVLVRERLKEMEANNRTEHEPQLLSDLVGQSGLRILVLGSGGSGKTSLLRKLASDCCRWALADTQSPLPFFAHLNYFDTHTNILDGLLSIVAREADISTKVLTQLWSDDARRCLFILDGINEVRPEFIGDCCLALQQLTQRTQHTYLVTSRPGEQATELKRQIDLFKEMEIVELDAHQIQEYLQNIGAGEIYNRMEDRLLALARSPFLLWAIVQSCIDLPNHELPNNIGQLYKNLIDGYIFGKREVSKPKEARPTRYNYFFVKKPVLARLAVEMCQQGATRWQEDNLTLKSIRDYLYELRNAYEGIQSLKPHIFMPEPFAKDLLDELVENGILRRDGMSLEFMHESVRDYFAAIEISEWPSDKVLQNVSPLIWRHIEPEYNELPVDGTLVQALIMSCGLRVDAGDLLRKLVSHHPLLAAHCLAAAQNIDADLRMSLIKQWLTLLDYRLTRYQWVGCQCLRAAKVSSTEVARRLFEIICSDSAWEVRTTAARAFASIDDTQVTKELVARAVNDIPKQKYYPDVVGSQFRHLQTDTLIVELLRIWGDPTETDGRKRRVEQLFANMHKRSIRQALRRMADGNSKHNGTGHISDLAQAALEGFDSWESSGVIHPDDARDLWQSSADRFQTETNQWLEKLSTSSREDVLHALRDSSAPKRAAAARSFAIHKLEAIAELLDAFAREGDRRVFPVLLETLRALDQPEVLYAEWRACICDQQKPLLFTVGSDFAEDFTEERLSERWVEEFKKRSIELKVNYYVHLQKQGWLITPGSYGGRLHDNPIYWLKRREQNIDVFDAAMRPKLVTVAGVIGPQALPVLEELPGEKDEFILIEVANICGLIATPKAVAILSSCLSQANSQDAIEAAINGLEKTRSKLAIQSLIDALRMTSPARESCDKIGRAIGFLDGVTSLIQLAQELLTHGDEDGRFATICALCNCGQISSTVEEIFVKAMDDRIPRVRKAAAEGLAQNKTPKSEKLLVHACINDSDEEVREKASKALRYFPGNAGVLEVISSLESIDEEIRVRAVEALIQIQDDAVIPSLMKLLESEHPLTRIAVVKALDALGFSQVETLTEILVQLVGTSYSITVRQNAARVLLSMSNGLNKLYDPIYYALVKRRYTDVIEFIGNDTPFLQDEYILYYYRGLARHSLGQNQEALADLDQTISLAYWFAGAQQARIEI